MKSLNGGRLFWIAWLVAAGVSSGQVGAELHQDFVCMHGSEKRVVSVFNLNSNKDARKAGGCRVDYTKGGQTTTVWSSKSDHAYCATKAASLVTNLVNGNFSCRAETREQPDDEADAADKSSATGADDAGSKPM